MISKYKYIAIACIIASSVSFSHAQDMTYGDIKKAIESSHSLRKELLDHSTGHAFLTLQNEKLAPEEKEKMMQQIGTSFKGKLRPYSGHGEWSVDWYNKGTTKRYDMQSDNSSDKNSDNFAGSFNRRVVATPENAIYYNVKSKEAYINKPPQLAINAAALIRNFDLDRLYNPSVRGSFPDYLSNLETQDLTRTVETEVVNSKECLKIEFRSNRKEVDPKLGWIPRNLVQFWVCPEMSYSLVKYRNQHNSFLRLSEDKLVLWESYDAEYEESKEHPGVWILKSMSRYEGSIMSKGILTCEFKDVKVGVDLPQEMFTFDGLGVLPGTKVYDMTKDNKEPPFYYYKALQKQSD